MFQIARGSDLTVTWTGASAGNVVVEIAGLSKGTVAILDCEFAVAPQAGVVPTAALAMLPAGMGSIGIGASSQAVVTDGDYSITLLAETGAVATDGTLAYAPVTLN
jgi:hypothetical protein